MCGIFGVIATKAVSKDQKAFLESAFQAGQVRGLHGSGMFTTTKSGEVDCAKRAMSGTEFLDSPELSKLASRLWSATAAIGHNRFATMGAHIDDNSHPFQFGHITGVHNGGIPVSVLSKIDPDMSHDIDSGRLYKALSEADDPLDVLREVHSGAYSLVWHDSKTNCMYLARNTHRPMNLVETPDALYLASELGMLGWLLARHDLLPKDKDIKVGETDLYTLYTIPIDDPSGVTTEKYKAVEVPPGKTFQSYGRQVSNVHNQHRGGGGSTTGTIKLPVDDKPSPDLVRTVYDLDTLEELYPPLKGKIEFIKSLMWREKGEIYHRINLIAYGSADKAQPAIYGMACSNTGAIDEYNSVLANMSGSAETMWSALDYIPTASDYIQGVGEDEVTVGYPIMQMQVKSFSLRPSGDIIINGTPIKNTEPAMYLYDVTDAEADWGIYVCSDDYMAHTDAATISIMWANLSDDEIPF